MSTLSYQATNTNRQVGFTKLYDIDTPEAFFRDIIASDADMNNWTINLLNHEGDILVTNLNWKNIPLRITTAGELLSFISLAK